MELIILAGGLGKRLRTLVNNVPKPMALINKKPFLEYLIDFWISNGVSKIIISIGYKGKFIKKHFQNLYKKFRYTTLLKNLLVLVED